MPTVDIIPTKPFDDQKPGTSGLRKRVTHFQQPYYLENFVQSIFDSMSGFEGGELIVGGDGRYYNDVAIQTIIKMALANGFGRVTVGQDGLLSTPAVSHLIRKREAFGGIILSASHNPGGPDGDFGIKYNANNGGPGTQALMEKVYARSLEIDRYNISSTDDFDLNEIGEFATGGAVVEIVDSVDDYALLMQELFDFDAIASLFSGGFKFVFDAMHAVTGPYAVRIFEQLLGAPRGTVINGKPSRTFGGGHPDPNLVHAKEIYDLAMQKDGPDLCAASDGDGDRNLIIGRNCYVAPSDSLAVIAANASLINAYRDGLVGVARSMPTSGALDQVATALNLPLFETPTGWKFFGNLLDAGDISICGEESAGTGSNHVREKDGLWAVLMWLSILAKRELSVAEILRDHYSIYGRNYYARHDYEEVDAESAANLITALRKKLPELTGTQTRFGNIVQADEFSYYDVVDESFTSGQGIRILFEGGARIVYRLSGTGTVGATLRVYLERYVHKDGELYLEVNDALTALALESSALAGIERFTGRVAPDVIT